MLVNIENKQGCPGDFRQLLLGGCHLNECRVVCSGGL